MGGASVAARRGSNQRGPVASLVLLMLHMSVSWSDKPPIGHGSRKQPTRAKAQLAAAPFQIPGAIFIRRRLSNGFSSRGAPNNPFNPRDVGLALPRRRDPLQD